MGNGGSMERGVVTVSRRRGALIEPNSINGISLGLRKQIADKRKAKGVIMN